MNSKNGEPVITREREVYRNTRIINSSRKCVYFDNLFLCVRISFFHSQRFDRVSGSMDDRWTFGKITAVT